MFSALARSSISITARWSAELTMA
jgi:hypothetical protein